MKVLTFTLVLLSVTSTFAHGNYLMADGRVVEKPDNERPSIKLDDNLNPVRAHTK